MLTARQRIALWFVGLSTVVYITPTVFGAFFFYFRLTSALDHELKTLASSLGHAISLQGDKPHFRDWARVLQTEPSRSLSTIQLYDSNGQLLERYGAPGIDRLIRDKRETTESGKTMRIFVSPLVTPEGKTIGYLQIEASTKDRDAATRQFAWAMALIAPTVLIGLGICSYFVSDKATVPIQRTIDLLRQFMADASHELNTPLSIINASTEALERKLGKQAIEVKETAVITNSVERMQKIIDDLMLLAHLETPARGDVARDSVAVAEIIEQCLEDFSVKFERKGVLLQHSPFPSVQIAGDADDLQTMVTNLLENALRYTESGGTVKVDVTNGSNDVTIAIADTGSGIPEQSLPFIFDRFYRVDRSRSRTSGGSGLGLSITKAIVEAHKGNIQVKSKLGAGTQFIINLPLVLQS